MAVLSQPVAPASWREPGGIAPGGTLVLIPGRGEQPVLFTRFGRRIAGDGYRVHVVADATQDRARPSGDALRRGALYEPVPAGWAELADLGAVDQPVLGIHGADDPVSPLADARGRYAAAARAELVSIAGGRHDTLNDLAHRTVAATIVLLLERLRPGAQLAVVAVTETLGRAG